MSLQLQPTTAGVRTISPPRIIVIGVGGGGGNAVDNMISANESSSPSADLSSVEFIVANTDAQQLSISHAKKRIQLGPELTRGLGAGAKPQVGRDAAEEVEKELTECLKGADLVFITAGMGGGTGTGAAPVIARIARSLEALTIGVVSKPFQFEGIKRSRAAEEGIAELQKHVDTLIVIPNQNLFNCSNQTTSLDDAFKMADEVLHRGVRSITDTMIIPGKINLDFADVTTVMKEKGKAMIGTGFADSSEGENEWAIAAAERAISNPLLEENSIKGASGLLVNVTGGTDLTLHEYTQIMDRIGQEADPDAEIISGLLQSEEMNGKVQISVVATGLNSSKKEETPPPSSTTSTEKTHSSHLDKRPTEKTVTSTHQASAAIDTTRPHQSAQREEPSQEPTDYPHHNAAPAAPTIPNYHLDPRPTSSQHQPTSQPHSAHLQPTISTHAHPPRPLHQEETQPTRSTGGFFSNFFRRPPAQENYNPPQQNSNITSQNRDKPSTHASQQLYNPPRYYEDDNTQQNSELDVPTYLRRNNPPS